MRVFMYVVFFALVICFLAVSTLPPWLELVVGLGFALCFTVVYLGVTDAREEDLEDKERYAALKRQPPADNPSPVPATSEKGAQS